MKTLLFLTLLLALSFCPPVSAETNVGHRSITAEGMLDLDNITILKKNDRIEVQILEEKAARPLQLQVIGNGAAAGSLQLPYIGLAQAEGLTPMQVALNCKRELEKGHFKTTTVMIKLVK